ncbi:MAG: hypothetical protein AB7F74_02085, partial [Parvibaculaceae bacterium]
LGNATTGILFFGIVIVFACAYLSGLNAVVAFWLAYIFTRPLGASFGDLLSQPVEYGGFGLGTTVTSLAFLFGIVAIVLFMTASGHGEETVTLGSSRS